jgi:inner membrane protein
MDPITHGMVGLAIASISGEPIIGAVSIGATLGAMSPDLDIVMQCKGHLSYLKNHRGMSHSIPFLVGISMIISMILSFIFPGTTFLKILLWTFLGTLSHSLLDILNSYGAQIFWPLSKKRYSGSLLLVYDPVVIILSLYMLISNEPNNILSMKAGLIFFVYLYIRMIARNIICDKIIHRLGGEIHIKKVKLLPSMTRIHKWHFIVEAKEKFIVGEVNIFNRQFQVLKELEKREIPIYEEIVRSTVGEFFNNFTPMYHIDIQDKGDYYYVRFTDLRYIIKDDFLYHATAVVSKELETLEGVFHPYSLNQSVIIT